MNLNFPGQIQYLEERPRNLSETSLVLVDVSFGSCFLHGHEVQDLNKMCE